MARAAIELNVRRKVRRFTPSRVRAAIRPIAHLVGSPDSLVRAVVTAAAKDAGMRLTEAFSAAEAAVGPAADEGPPPVVVVSIEQAYRAEALAIRDQPGFREAIIIGVASRLSDVLFEEALSVGIDDCCVLDPEALARMLRSVDLIQTPRAKSRGETVVVADADHLVRGTIGRVFRRVGYRVEFTDDAISTHAACQGSDVAVVVVSSAIATESAGSGLLSTWAFEACPSAAWIVNAPPKEMRALSSRVEQAGKVKMTVHDAYAAASSLLFVSNALRSPGGAERRTEERLLYGTMVRFRRAGREDGQTGFTYNVSGGGLYVRTLSPPAVGEKLWIELVPPRCDQWVHVEATVAWARTTGPEASAAVPPGFGVQITGGSNTDLSNYQAGCQRYHQERVPAARGR